MSNLHDLVIDYMREQKLMQLASVADGAPWVCSVWQAPDEDLNIYFLSATNRRHSQEIAKDNRVAGAMALPHKVTDPPRGLQFEGTAEQLSDPEDVAMARAAYEGKALDKETIEGFMSNPDRPHAFYRITPSRFVLFDVVNFPDDPRQELILRPRH